MVALVEHGDREARIEVDVAHVADALARPLQRRIDAGERGRVGRQVGPLRQLQLGRGSDGVDMHPLFFRHAQLARQSGAGDDHRRRLIHLIARHGHARIGFRHNPVALGDGGEFFRAALDRRGGVGIGSCDLGEGREQLADFQPVFLQPHPQLVTPRILGQRIKRDRTACPMGEQHRLHQFLDPEALILEVAADFFRPVGDLALGRQRQHGRNRLAADDNRAAAVACRNGARKLAHQLLVGLPAGGGEDRAGGIGPHPLGNRARHIVRCAERRLPVRARHFESADRGERVDGIGHRPAGPAIGYRRRQRPSGKVHIGEGGIAGLADPLGILPHADDDGGVIGHLSQRNRPPARR